MAKKLPTSASSTASDDYPFPREALNFRFVRSGGPGGQHVNKVATAVQLRVYLDRSSLPAVVQRRLIKLAGSRAVDGNQILIFADRFRSQVRNREDALQRLDTLVAKAKIAPKKRIATKPSKAAVQRAKDSKLRRGQQKNLRKPPSH